MSGFTLMPLYDLPLSKYKSTTILILQMRKRGLREGEELLRMKTPLFIEWQQCAGGGGAGIWIVSGGSHLAPVPWGLSGRVLVCRDASKRQGAGGIL